jgi:transcriptional regulator with XRE-family HTH domain
MCNTSCQYVNFDAIVDYQEYGVMLVEQGTELSAFVRRQMEQRGLGLRATERFTGVSKGSLHNLLENPDTIPELETLVKLSRAFELPLWRLIEMCGVDLGLSATPSDPVQRLAGLLESMPDMRPIANHLLSLHPEDIDGLLAYLEAQKLRREQRHREGR